MTIKTIEQIKDAVPKAKSFSELLEILGYPQSGGSYARLKRRIKIANIDISHLRRKWTGGFKQYKLEEILVEHSSYQDRTTLKKRLLNDKLLTYHCYNDKCAITNNWLGTPITLQIDHINGINDDHRLENLRLLCPNCHSQTSTFTGRNRIGRKAQPGDERHEKTCSICSKPLTNGGTLICRQCRKIERIHPNAKLSPMQVEEIKSLYIEGKGSHRSLAKVFDVSPPTIVHILKESGIETRPPKLKFNPDQIKEIRRLSKDGMNYAKIARQFSTSDVYIRKIVLNEYYRS